MEGPFRDPGIPDGERTAYRGLIGGEDAGTGQIVVRHTDGGYRQEVSARGPGDVRLEMAMTFARRREAIHAEDYRLETRQGEDGLIAVEEGRFRHVKPLHVGGVAAPYPRDLVPLLGVPVALRGLEWERGATRTFSAWLANMAYGEVEARVERPEPIDLPAGRVEAWRVALRPMLEQIDRTLDKLVAGLMPPLVMHFGCEAPHRFLRFAFPTGPFRTDPTGIVEATEL
jgi:hypothetical protein